MQAWENGYCESFNGRMRPSRWCQHHLPVNRWIAERWNLLFVTRGSDNHWKLEKTLPHQTTPQCSGLPPTCARGHRPDGPKANHALTFKLDNSSGAAHFNGRVVWPLR